MSSLRPILNPFGRAQKQGVDLVAELRADLAEGKAHLDEMVAQTRDEIEAAKQSGAGIVYLLHGARMALTTPMEYGGHFLELDRMLLEGADGCTRMVFVVGGADTFLDFVSDLPAEIFAWDPDCTGVSVAEMRRLRSGLLAAHSPEADIFLDQPGEITAALEIPQLAHA